jgi:hypothetical protein
MSQQSAVPKNMRAIAIEGGVGPARALILASIKTPTPKSGEVLIRVAAAGVNYPDIIQYSGRDAIRCRLGHPRHWAWRFRGPSRLSVPTCKLRVKNFFADFDDRLRGPISRRGDAEERE